jgi:hypothetical protein
LGYRVFNVFYDAGALWDKAQPVVGRHSAGFGFGGLRTDNNWYISLAFPLRTSGVKPVFMMGVRF